MTGFNPFNERPENLDEKFLNWEAIYPKSYNKYDTDPYTKLRCILMNGTEYEAAWFSHNFSRHCNNNDIRRELAVVRRNEQQQQKRIASLKPINETILETTISYEQLAVDLTAILAQNEKDAYVKQALDFALLEDFDHLYRYANLLDMEHGIDAERLVGGYTDITPGRPTISEHRYGFDDVRRFINCKTADASTKLNVNIITAAEQQTMNYYNNQGSFYTSDLGRQLYHEIAMIEEQHVTHYGSLIDPNATWLEGLLMHEYTECYLYYSCFKDETDPQIKKIWEQHLIQEIAHLHKAASLLKNFEKKEWQQVIPDGSFPTPLNFSCQKDYVRNVLKNTVKLTTCNEDYKDVNDKANDSKFFMWQNKVNKDVPTVPSHKVIDQYINKNGEDFRAEDGTNPVQELRDRHSDNTQLGRVKYKVNTNA